MTTTPISENGSENRKRGRPRRADYHGQLRTHMEANGVYNDVQTERGKQNRDNALCVIGVLLNHPNPDAIRWLFDGPAHAAGKKKMRFGILAELGRIHWQHGSDEEIHGLATLLSERKPKTRDAVAMLRRHRMNTHRPGSVLHLEKSICGTIDAYLATHPGTTKQQVLAALTSAMDAVTNTEWPEADGK